MSINIIAAMAKNRVIGINNKLPWNIPDDLKYFKKLTSQNKSAVVMGRKTWDSLPIKPLPNRRNYVLTKNNYHLTFPDALVLKQPDDIVKFKTIYDEIWIIGGQTIYDEYINKPYIDRIYLTEINAIYKGDTYFPELPKGFLKTIQGKTRYFSKNSLEFTSYNYNMYSNCNWSKERSNYNKL